MQITLPPEAQAIIDRKIAAGEYATEEEVIVSALAQMDLGTDIPYVPEELLARAREQSAHGEGRPLTEEVMRQILTRARARANQGLPARDDDRY